MSGPAFILSLLLVPAIVQGVTPSPPKTPDGLAPCHAPLQLENGVPRATGERLTYQLEMFGLSLGTAKFSIERRGLFEGRAVTHYGVDVDSSSLFQWVSKVEGSGASLIEDGRSYPIQATSRYRFRKEHEEELQTYSRKGHHVYSERHHNGTRLVKDTSFSTPVLDFLTGFYFLRGLNPQDQGCTIIYTGHKAFTLWIQPEQAEALRTNHGILNTTRYKLRYASEGDNHVKAIRIWISNDNRRIPLKITGLQRFKPQAVLEHYRPALH